MPVWVRVETIFARLWVLGTLWLLVRAEMVLLWEARFWTLSKAAKFECE